MLKVDFLTLFPEMVLDACRHSILARAQENQIVSFSAVNPRDFTYDRHKKVDDAPFGGGPGMLMAVEPIELALASIGITTEKREEVAVVLTDPTGNVFKQKSAQELSTKKRVVFLCGHYEGFDDRIKQLFATHVYSIGDYVLTGGELPSLVMADSVVRLLPGVLGSASSLEIDSHSDGLLSAPQFTRPVEYRGLQVPDVLRSGDHAAIKKWQRAQSLRATRDLRPDLLTQARLDIRDLDVLSS